MAKKLYSKMHGIEFDTTTLGRIQLGRANDAVRDLLWTGKTRKSRTPGFTSTVLDFQGVESANPACQALFAKLVGEFNPVTAANYKAFLATITVGLPAVVEAQLEAA